LLSGFKKKNLLFNFLSIRVIERTPPAPTELKKTLKRYEMLFSLKPQCMCWLCMLAPIVASSMSVAEADAV